MITTGELRQRKLEMLTFISTWPTGLRMEDRNLHPSPSQIRLVRMKTTRAVTVAMTIFAVEDAVLAHRPRAAAEVEGVVIPRLVVVAELCTILGATLARVQ